MPVRFTLGTLTLAALTALGCASQTTTRVESGGEVMPGRVPASARVLPVGTTMQVALDRPITASHDRVGDRFTAHVTDAIVAENGATAVRAGATVGGTITGLEPSRGNQPGLVRLNFETLQVDGRDYAFDADITQTSVPSADNRDVVSKAGAGAVAGAVLGAVLGRGNLKDIVLGGAIGAAAGTLISLGTSTESNATLPAGTRLTLHTTRRVVLLY